MNGMMIGFYLHIWISVFSNKLQVNSKNKNPEEGFKNIIDSTIIIYGYFPPTFPSPLSNQ